MVGGQFVAAQYERMQSNRSDIPLDVIELANNGEFGLLAKSEAYSVKIEQQQEQLGLWRWSILRLSRHWWLHGIFMILGMIGNGILNSLPNQNPVVHHFISYHVAICCLWLVLIIICSLVTLQIKRQVPDLERSIFQV